MIFAGWVGVGKSFYKEKYKNIIDLETSKFRWNENFENLSIREYENKKRNSNNSNKNLNPSWPQNYFEHLIQIKDKYDAVLIPIQQNIINLLIENKIDFIAVFPDISCKEEYKRRYFNRGNNENFIKHILEVWDEKYIFLKTNNINIYKLHANEYIGKALDEFNIIPIKND